MSQRKKSPNRLEISNRKNQLLKTFWKYQTKDNLNQNNRKKIYSNQRKAI